MIALSPLPLCKGKLSLFCNQKTTMFSNVDTMLSQDPPPQSVDDTWSS